MIQYSSQGFAKALPEVTKSKEPVKESEQDHYSVEVARARRKFASIKLRSEKHTGVNVVKGRTRKRKARTVQRQVKDTPIIPRKVLRVLSILRHIKFLRVVARYFKPLSNKIVAPIEPTVPSHGADL